MNPNEQLEAIEKIIQRTEAKIASLDPERVDPNAYWALGYQQIKQLIEDNKESTEDG